MRNAVQVLALSLVLLVPVAAVAQVQTPATPVGEADPGVRPTRLIDRDEIRVSRLELQAGAVRRVHAHDDVEYHLWIPLSGSLEITIGTDRPVAATAGQAFFLKRGTQHGFRNTGSGPATAFEIFVKKSTTSAEEDPMGLLGGVLAALRP